MTTTSTPRIFQVLSASANASISDNRTWYRNLHEPLLDLGIDVHLFPAEMGKQALRRNKNKLRRKFSEDLLKTFVAEHKRKPFSLFFSYLMDGMIDKDALEEIRHYGVPMVNFSCNNAHQFHLVKGISPTFDLNLHAERDAAEKFLAIGAKPLWWPMASNPKYFFPRKTPRDVAVSFAGANYGPRARIAATLLREGIDLKLYGPNWQHAAKTKTRSVLKRGYYLARYLISTDPYSRAQSAGLIADHEYRTMLSHEYPNAMHPPLSDESLIELYSRSHVSLGVLDVFDNHNPALPTIKHLHLREFEAPMCGALYCTGYTEELAEMFEPDKEVLVYRSPEELVDKCRYYLDNPSAGNRIREAGLKRALADHTYTSRFSTLFQTLGI